LWISSSLLDAGKNKRLTKGKKGGKKKAQDPFARKELYTIKAPSIFAVRNAGKTIVTKTFGTSKFERGLHGPARMVILLIKFCRDCFGLSQGPCVRGLACRS
jgi:small subunit ribosomal protein S3Ae